MSKNKISAIAHGGVNKSQSRTDMPPPEVHESDPMPKEASKNGKQTECSQNEAKNMMESISVRERFNMFMNETSFTALTRIHKANSILKRIIWFIVLVAMLAWLSVQCYWLLEKYFNYPVDVKIELNSAPRLDFPSVTICNRNPLRKSMIASSPFSAMENDFLKVKRDDSLYNRAMTMFSGGGSGSDEDSDSDENDNALAEPESLATTTDNAGPAETTTSTAIGPESLTTTAPSGQPPAPPSTGGSPGTQTTTTYSGQTETTSAPGSGTATPGSSGQNSTALPTVGDPPATVSLLEQMKESSFNIWDALSDPDTAKTFYETKDSECSNMLAYAGFAASIDHDELEGYGHSMKQMLMSCRFNGYPCSISNFTYVHNSKYGNCYTFNHHQNNMSSVYSSYPGPLMGLALEFNIEQKEYVEALASDAGIRVLVHQRGTYPFPDDSGFSIAPGFVTSVGIKEIRINRLPPPHANCANEAVKTDYYRQYFGTSYAKMPCLKSCIQDIILTKCSCAVAYYIIPKGASVCDTSNATLMQCLTEAFMYENTCDAACPSPCSETKYEPFLSTSFWPSEAYMDSLEERLMKSSTDFMHKDDLDDKDENLAKLEVFFSELLYQNIEQQKGYESQNLISDIGGQLGLWLGLSAITIGELVEFFAAVFKAVTAKAVRRKHNYDNNPARAFRNVAMRATRRTHGVGDDGTRLESLTG